MNPRPFAPEANALPGCATLRHSRKACVVYHKRRQPRKWRPPALAERRSSEAEIALGVVVRDVLDDLPEPLHVGRDLAVLDLLAELLAEDAAEVLVARVAEEAARVGEHADEVAEAAERGKRLELLAHAVLLVEEPPAAAELYLADVGPLLEAAHD